MVEIRPNENACHPERSEGSLKSWWSTLDSKCDQSLVGEIPCFTRDDRVCGLVVFAETAVPRRHFIFAIRSRSQRQIAPCHSHIGPEIPGLDSIARYFAGVDRRNASI